ncbi:MAG: ATP-binding protein [Desulfobacterales bacterium]
MRETNHVLVNLMLDAMKFRRMRIDVTVSQPEYQLVYAVKDDGEGFPVANHDSIFRNTFKGRTSGGFPIRGHGIGLAGYQALPQEMSGHLRL